VHKLPALPYSSWPIPYLPVCRLDRSEEKRSQQPIKMAHEKSPTDKEIIEPHNGYGSETVDEEVGVVNKSGTLNRDLKSRHMQMIAIGTSQPLAFASSSFGHSKS
jgi:hypothetical protein